MIEIVTAASLIAKVSVEGDDTSRNKLKAFSDVVDRTQNNLGTKLVAATKSASGGLANVGSKASAAGVDFSKFNTLQVKSSEAAAKLGVAQTQAALALKKANDAASGGKASAEQIADAQAKASLAAQKVTTAENAVGVAMQKAAKESDQLSTAMKENASKSSIFSKGITSFKTSLGQLANVAKGVAVAAVTALGVALVAVGGALVSTIKPAANFQATLLKIQALAGLSKTEVAAASDEILKMSGKVGKGPQDLAEGLYFIASAGYDAKTSMQILEVSAKAAAVGMTDTQVVANAMTAALKAFPGMSVANAMDIMTKTVSTGKTEWADYAGIVGEVSLASSQANVKFTEGNAAFAVLTNTMKSSSEASTALKGLMQSASHVSDLTDRAKGLGLAFDASNYKTLSFIDKLKYLDKVTGGNSESMKKLLGTDEAMVALSGLLAGGATDYAKALEGITNSAGAADTATQTTAAGAQAAWDRATAAAQALQIKVGTALLPVITAFTDKIAPMIMSSMNWVTQNQILEKSISAIGTTFNTAVSFFQSHQGAFIALAAIVGGILVTAFAAWGISVIAATWPILLIGAAIGALAAGFIYLYSNSAPFRDFINGLGQAFMQLWSTISTNFIPVMQQIGNVIMTQVWPVLAGIGAFLLSIFKPVWDELVTMWQTQLLPAFADMAPVLQPLGMLLGALAMIVGTVLVVALGLLVGLIKGVVTAFAALLSGVIQAFGGIVQFVMGFVQILSGIMALVVDIITGNWSNIAGDIETIGGGILTMLVGFGNIFMGIVGGLCLTVAGFFWGLVTGVIDFFRMLFDRLVGHSIIPDMVNGIISWFAQLPGRALGAIQSLAGSIGSFFTNIATDALNAGSNIVKNIADGITGAIHFVTEAIGNVTQWISDHLPHSPAKIGPLRYLAQQGEEISNQVAKGIMSGMPILNTAMDALVKPVSMSFSTDTPNGGALSIPAGVNLAQIGTSNQSSNTTVQVFMGTRDITDIVQTKTLKGARQGGPLRGKL